MTNIVEAVTGTIHQLLIRSRRSIGGITPNVVIEETGRDTMFVTNHPVEKGATISDHAFMMPVELEMSCGWSDSTGGYEGYSSIIYQALRSLQSSREPFTATTKKRSYPNMLISSLEVRTDSTSEYALMVRLVLREVIIVSTQTTTSSTTSDSANAAKNSPVSSGGVKYAESAAKQSPSYASLGGTN